MKRIKALVYATGLIVLGILPSSATLRIVATTPDLADITRQIGGDLVKVESLAKGTEDIHAVPQKPSFIPKLNQAEGVVLIGLEAEHAFLPALLDVAQNPNILRDRPGYIDCSAHLVPLDIPTNLSRAEGELHAQGNPHYNFAPQYGGLIADTIAEGLSRLDPAHADVYARHRDAFKKELAGKIEEWKKIAAPLRGVKAISHHADLAYFADFLKLDMVGTIELKPGIAATPRHLEEMVGLMKRDKVPLIIHEIQYPKDTAEWVAHETGAKIADIAAMAGAFPDSKTYFGMIDHNIHALLDAVK